MRALPSSTPLRLLGSLCLASIAWTACQRIPIPGESTEAASDAATAAGSSGSGGSGVHAPIEARFSLPDSDAPDFLAVPFPSDLYKDAKGSIGAIPELKGYVLSGSTFINAGLGQLDGFGTTAGAIFAIDDHTQEAAAPAAIDAATLPATEADTTSASATVMLVDLEAASAATALVPARAEYHSDAPNGATTPPLLVIYPARGVVLAEKHRYAAVLTTGSTPRTAPRQPERALRRRARRRAARLARREALRRGRRQDCHSRPRARRQEHHRRRRRLHHSWYGPRARRPARRAHQASSARARLEAGVARADGRRPLRQRASPAGAAYTATLDAWLGSPATLADMTDDPADDQTTGRAHDALAAVGTAVYNAPNLLIESAMTFNDPAHHTFARDASGKPVVNPLKATSKIWMTIALPKGPVPPGLPTVIVQHGINGDRSLVLSVANTFAKMGWATVGIETVTFGARASAPDNTADKKSTFPWSTGSAYAGPDGFVDLPAGATEFFGGLRSLGAVRDHMRQSVLDLGSAVDVVRNPALDLGPLLAAVPGAKLDPSRVAFLGDSLGGMMGAMLAAVDPHLKAFVLNVAGGGLLLELGSSSPNIAASLTQAGAVNFGFGNARFAPSHPLMQLLQHIVDPGDPLLYARNIITSPLTINGAKNPPKDVIQIEVLWDETVANPSNEALARAAGFPLAEPNVGSMAQTPLGTAAASGGVISNVPIAGTTAALIQAGPATHSSDLFSAKGLHHYKHPAAQFDQLIPFRPSPARSR